jgi:TPR repeat protein
MTRTTVIVALAASCASLVALLGGCGETRFELGAVKQAEVPYDVHAKHAPDPIEVAANPCKYGDAEACAAKCQSGDSTACNAVGILYEFDGADGVSASGFYARACDASYAPGCTNLAWLYSLGRGVPHDSTHAMALFTRAYEASRLACRRGDSSGCMMAGQALLEGRGVAQDEAQALAYFTQACDHGERKGCDYASMLR